MRKMIGNLLRESQPRIDAADSSEERLVLVGTLDSLPQIAF
jgi:hypothetical protein